jgi:hypothetical protein
MINGPIASEKRLIGLDTLAPFGLFIRIEKYSGKKAVVGTTHNFP